MTRSPSNGDVIRFSGRRWKPSVGWSFAERRWVWTNQWYLYDQFGEQVLVNGAAVWKIAPPPDYPPKRDGEGEIVRHALVKSQPAKAE